MVQVDVFWSFGLGAGFAMASARQLRLRDELRSRPATEGAGKIEAAGADERDAERELAIAGETGGRGNFSDLLQNRFMVQNILYAALLFAPSGIYLLWDFTNWETMQAGAKSMPAWLVVSFAITNVTQAILGFWVVERLVVKGRQYLGLLAAWAGYFGMFFILVNGWDKTGWHRFFSEDRADFEAWSSEPAIDQVTSWLTSDVALTLYAMGVILIPAMAVIMMRSIRGGYKIGGDYRPDRKPAGAALMVAGTTVGLLSGVPAAIVAHLLITETGWVLGSVAAAAVIFVALLWTRTGLLFRGYRRLGLEDADYQRRRDAGSSAGGGRTRPRPVVEPSYSNQ